MTRYFLSLLLAALCFCPGRAVGTTILLVDYAQIGTNPMFFPDGSWEYGYAFPEGVFSLVEGVATGDGSVMAAVNDDFSGVDVTDKTHLLLRLRVNEGNEINTLSVVFYELAFPAPFANAEFSLAGITPGVFTTLVAPILWGPEENPPDLFYFNLLGDGTSQAAHLSFESLSATTLAIPEPGSVGLLMALGLAVWGGGYARRRMIKRKSMTPPAMSAKPTT